MLIVEESLHKKRNVNLDDSMIPAINIVFLLLIFFMIAGHIEARNTLLEIPESESAGEIQEENMLAITILADGRRLLNNEPITGSLEKALASQKVDQSTTLTLHIHKQLPVTQLDPVLLSAKKLGVERLQIVTETLL